MKCLWCSTIVIEEQIVESLLVFLVFSCKSQRVAHFRQDLHCFLSVELLWIWRPIESLWLRWKQPIVWIRNILVVVRRWFWMIWGHVGVGGWCSRMPVIWLWIWRWWLRIWRRRKRWRLPIVWIRNILVVVRRWWPILRVSYGGGYMCCISYFMVDQYCMKVLAEIDLLAVATSSDVLCN